MGDLLTFPRPTGEPVEPKTKQRRNTPEVRFINAFCRLIADGLPPLAAGGAAAMEDLGVHLTAALRDPALTIMQRAVGLAIAHALLAEAVEIRVDDLTADDGPETAA